MMLPQPEGLQSAGGAWHVFDLGAACTTGGGGAGAGGGAGSGDAGVATWLPASCAALRSLRSMGGQTTPLFAPLKVQFSTMGAGVHVRPHTGPTNAKLTLHYGLDVEVGASVRVGSEWRPFVEREILAFDDSFEHEVWQNSSRSRTTIVLHVRHPGLASDGELGRRLAAKMQGT